MTGYDYTDGAGRSLHVHPFLPGPAMEITAPDGTVNMGPDEGPNLARAALRLSGIEAILTPSATTEVDHLTNAMWHLVQAKKHRAKTQKEEHERLRHGHIEGGLTRYLTDEEAEDIPQEVLDKMVRWVADTYEKDADKTAPEDELTVLHGWTTEPAQQMRFRTARGWELEHDGEMWAAYDKDKHVGRYTWVNIPRSFFPMTQVTTPAQGRRTRISHADLTILDRARHWRDHRGLVWNFAGGNWAYILTNGERAVTQPANFPWTQVDPPAREQKVLRSPLNLRTAHAAVEWQDKEGLFWSYSDLNRTWLYRTTPYGEAHHATPKNFPWREVMP